MMQIDGSRRHGLARAATVVILAGLLAGCVGPSEPAPVYLRGASDPVIAPMPAPPPALQVIVKRGQTLDGYAYTYHLPKSAIVAANGLRPPYKLEAGQRLTIPNPRGSVQQAMIPPPAPAARPWSPSPVPPQQQAAVPQPPRAPEAIAAPAPASNPPQTIFATPAQPLPTTQPTPAQASPPPTAPPPAAAKSQPDIIPLDGPPPVKEAEAAPPKPPATLTPPQQPLAQLTPPQAVVPPTSASPPASAAPGAQTDAAPPGGRFPWPVRGRVLGAYGNSPGGGHNDGINIAAPLGTPVRAIDGGTVVYSGNEVKGYGNIVLIRHANGWISAYAHLEDVDVKQGDAISPGEVIAKVGNSGGVTEPQLHFELRRGKKPVNPTEFLAPAPSAEGAGNGAG
jgi:murein DD-endopeptidase MepM/ murein hydrolase activator NlpD